MLGKIKVKTKAEMIYNQLRKAIIGGEMKPGNRYSVAELAKKFGTSRSPVYEAVKLLEAQDMIEIIPNVGFQIRRLTRQEIYDVLSIRGVLEGLAIKRAIENIDNEKFKDLEDILNRIEYYIKNKEIEQYLDANEEFHFKLYRASGSNRIVQALKDYWMHEVWYARELEHVTDKIKILTEDHKKMLKAIKNRDTDIIQKIVEEHVEHCADIVLKNMNSI